VAPYVNLSLGHIDRYYLAPAGCRYRVGTTCRVSIDWLAGSIGDQQEIVRTVKARSAGHSSRMRITGVSL
jgi:hypothetical protein